MITKKKIAEYVALEKKRKKLNREAEQVGKQAQLLEEEFMQDVRERGGETRTIKSCGYILAIKTKANSVQWKPEFIRVASLAAAEEVIKNAGTKEVFSFEEA